MSSSLPILSFQGGPSVGLLNLGNTCFLNSVLQALRLCRPAVSALLPTTAPRLRPTSKRTAILEAFQRLMLEMQGSAENAVVRPTDFLGSLLHTIRACDDDWYQPHQQGDAAECLQYILDSLHDSVYRCVRSGVQGAASSRDEESQVKALESWSSFFSKEYSPIVENFYGQSQIQIRCEACRTVSERYEPWMMMKVPIPGGDVGGGDVPSFSACMDVVHKPEEIEAYQCDHCKKRGPATMTTRISKLPNILILVFKRFNNRGQKIRGEIDWSLDQMSLAPWLAFRRCPFTDKTARSSYRTFAVIEHHGSTRGGHYRMFSRQVAAEAPWIEYDDDAIRTVSDPRQIVSPDSYVILASPN